jgi:hypothetical protein
LDISCIDASSLSSRYPSSVVRTFCHYNVAKCLYVSEKQLFLVQKEWREKREDFKKKVRRIVRKSQEMF